MKYSKSNLTKSNKRGGKSPTSKLTDWQPKTGKPFRDTKRPMHGVTHPKPNKSFP